MDFERIPDTEISTLPSTLLASRLPNSAQLLNRALLYNQIEFELSFYYFKGLPLSTTCIVSNLRRMSKSYWLVLEPEMAKEETIIEIVESFGKIIDWSEDNAFDPVEQKMYGPIKKLCGISGNWIPKDFHSAYWMEKIDAIELKNESMNSDEGYLRELVPEDVCDTIMKYWKYASADEYDNIVNGIRHMGSAGVVVGGKLVSWAVCLLDGAIHALYTLEEHRQKGHAKLALKFICLTIAERGYIPVVLVEADNVASQSLMLNVGFKFSHKFSWIEFKKAGNNELGSD